MRSIVSVGMRERVMCFDVSYSGFHFRRNVSNVSPQSWGLELSETQFLNNVTGNGTEF